MLSEELCQDSLALVNKRYRVKNDNPTVYQFLKNTVSLRIQSSVAKDPVRGNCRKGPMKESNTHDLLDETPLPKRKRSW